MKKLICGLSLILISCILLYSHPQSVAGEAKTLQDLYNYLNSVEAELKAKQNDKALTEKKINEIKNNMIKIGLDIQDTEAAIAKLKEEITNLNNDITKKDNEIKKIMSYVQLTNGDNVYLEYIFGAQTLNDFVYRMSIAEQITSYNNRMIDEMNKAIDSKNNKTTEMNNKLITLEKKEKELVAEQKQLGSKMNLIDEDMMDINEEIRIAKKTIKNYESLGCKPTDLLANCSQIPPDSDFLRPLVSGKITSGYGLRFHPTEHVYKWHYAYDIGGNPTGTPVYAAAAGRVVAVSYVSKPNVAGSSCGGNMVVLQHYVDGKFYATRYLHLHSINVSVNQTVTSNTVIGTVGGGEAYDRCTTGPHLDFSVAKGIYAQDFYSFKAPYTIEPNTLINFPAYGVYFSSRYQRY